MNPRNKKIILICGALVLCFLLVLLLTTCQRNRNQGKDPLTSSSLGETDEQGSESESNKKPDSSGQPGRESSEQSSENSRENSSSYEQETDKESSETEENTSETEETEESTSETEENNLTKPTGTPTPKPTPTPTLTPTPKPVANNPTPTPTAALVPTKQPESSEPSTEDEVSISELALQYGFTLGGCIGNSQMSNTAYKTMITDHFDSVTATNELKAYSLLSQWRSQNSANGMPVMDYTNADKIVAWAQANGIGVRGHVLVWDAYMTDWFFREGYSSTGAYVDKETMKARLEYYINDVITHFETKYPGVVYCWDVVNEAVGDSSSDYRSNDPCHIRVTRNGSDNLFYKYVGEDYVYLSFLYARNTIDRLGSGTKLFYNDYNTFYPEKRTAICNLITSINTYATDSSGNYRRLCDGVGMQGYIGGYGQQNGCMNQNDLTLIKSAILTYASLGLDVHVTELAVRNYDSSSTVMAQHAAFYADLFEVFIAANRETGGALKNVTIWGLCDNPNLPASDYSYSMNGPYCGLFDQNYRPKNSYYAVYDVLAP